MLEYDWKAHKGTLKIDLFEPRNRIKVKVASSKEVKMFGVRGKEKVPLKIGAEFRFAEVLGGFDRLLLIGTGDTEFGYSVSVMPFRAEEIDPTEPASPPLPNANANMLLQIKRLFEEENRRNRIPVFDPEDLPGASRYDIDDEDGVLFEEDIWQRAQDKKREQEEKRAEEATQPPTTPVDPPEVQDPPSEVKPAQEAS